MHRTECYYIADIEWPCALSLQARMSLLDVAKPCRDTSLRAQQPGLFYVVSGCLVNYMITPTTENSLGLVLGRGSWFGIQSICCEEHIYEVYEPIHSVELLFFSKDNIEYLLKQEPTLYEFLFHIAQKMNRFSFQLSRNTLHGLKYRVIYALLHLAEYSINWHARKCVIHITQHALGHIVGATRPRVNEVLKILSDAELICLGRGKITILRPDLLQAKLTPVDYPYHLPKVV